VPTNLRLAPGSPVRARGPLRDDQPVHDLDGLPVYPDGTAVTLRLPISAPAGSGEIPVEVRVSYMACTAEACLVPVNDAPLILRVPGDGSAPAAVGGGAALDDIRAVIREELAGTQAKLRAELRAELAAAAEPHAIRWRRPADRAAAEAL